MNEDTIKDLKNKLEMHKEDYSNRKQKLEAIEPEHQKYIDAMKEIDLITQSKEELILLMKGELEMENEKLKNLKAPSIKKSLSSPFEKLHEYELGSSKKKLNDYERNLIEIKDNNNSMINDIYAMTTANHNYSVFTDKISSLSQSIYEYVLYIIDLENRINYLKEEVKLQTDKLYQVDRLLSNTNSQLESYGKIHESLIEKHNLLTDQLRDTTESMSLLKSELVECNVNRSQLYSSLEGINIEYEKELEKTNSMIKQGVDEIKDLENMLKVNDREIEDLNAEIATYSTKEKREKLKATKMIKDLEKRLVQEKDSIKRRASDSESVQDINAILLSIISDKEELDFDVKEATEKLNEATKELRNRSSVVQPVIEAVPMPEAPINEDNIIPYLSNVINNVLDQQKMLHDGLKILNDHLVVIQEENNALKQELGIIHM